MKTLSASLLAGAFALSLASPAFAQSYGAYGSGSSALSLQERPLTPEEIEQNGKETVIVHFMGGVSSMTTLQLIVSVQDYFRKGYRDFIIPIQTNGGSVYAAMYAYETLKRMPITISTMAVGNVDSAGIFLFCLGEKRYAAPESSFLFHPMSGAMNVDMRRQEAAKVALDNLISWSNGLYEDCFSGTREEWDLERQDYRLSAVEAGEVGLVNSGADYFQDVETVGEVSYVMPFYYAQSSTYPSTPGTRQDAAGLPLIPHQP